MQLKADEKAFADSLDPGVLEVVHGKRLLLWKEMLLSIDYSDIGGCDEFFIG